jgi:hypothetical protein
VLGAPLNVSIVPLGIGIAGVWLSVKVVPLVLIEAMLVLAGTFVPITG